MEPTQARSDFEDNSPRAFYEKLVQDSPPHDDPIREILLYLENPKTRALCRFWLKNVDKYESNAKIHRDLPGARDASTSSAGKPHRADDLGNVSSPELRPRILNPVRSAAGSPIGAVFARESCGGLRRTLPSTSFIRDRLDRDTLPRESYDDASSWRTSSNSKSASHSSSEQQDDTIIET